MVYWIDENPNKNTTHEIMGKCKVPYARHHKPLLIKSRSWIQAIHKDRIFWKNLLKNKEMVFENGVKNIQAAAYDGARTVFVFSINQIWAKNTFLTQLPFAALCCP